MKSPNQSDYDHPIPAQSFPQMPSDRVSYVRIDETVDGQRLDNYLVRIAKGVPKSHLYRLVRGGEVRVNKKRTQVSARLSSGDILRLPPLRVSEKKENAIPVISESELPVLFEDRHLLIVNKPEGLAAHGGSGISFGLIERLRASRPQEAFLELAHRLDRDTSGAIILCKTRKALVRLQAMQRESAIEKHYRLLVEGDWVNERQHVKKALFKYTLASGERRVRVDEAQGLHSHTIFTVLKRFGSVTYLDAQLKTGRTHQIRVHAQSENHPLVGDDKYGRYEFNDAVAKGALGKKFKRMFLHAYELKFEHPVSGEMLHVVAPIPEECQQLLNTLSRGE